MYYYFTKDVVKWDREKKKEKIIELLQIERELENVSRRVDDYLFSSEYKEKLVSIEFRKVNILRQGEET